MTPCIHTNPDCAGTTAVSGDGYWRCEIHHDCWLHDYETWTRRAENENWPRWCVEVNGTWLPWLNEPEFCQLLKTVEAVYPKDWVGVHELTQSGRVY